MKSIVERAREAYPINEYSIIVGVMIRGAYIRGAKEQQAIDEEVRLKKSDDMTKAEYDRETAFADWYLKNGKSTPTFSDAIEWARKQTIDEVCNWFSNKIIVGTEGELDTFLNITKNSYGGDVIKQIINELTKGCKL